MSHELTVIDLAVGYAQECKVLEFTVEKQFHHNCLDEFRLVQVQDFAI